jgi:hypothetical protein
LRPRALWVRATVRDRIVIRALWWSPTITAADASR